MEMCVCVRRRRSSSKVLFCCCLLLLLLPKDAVTVCVGGLKSGFIAVASASPGWSSYFSMKRFFFLLRLTHLLLLLSGLLVLRIDVICRGREEEVAQFRGEIRVIANWPGSIAVVCSRCKTVANSFLNERHVYASAAGSEGRHTLPPGGTGVEIIMFWFCWNVDKSLMCAVETHQ